MAISIELPTTVEEFNKMIEDNIMSQNLDFVTKISRTFKYTLKSSEIIRNVNIPKEKETPLKIKNTASFSGNSLDRNNKNVITKKETVKPIENIVEEIQDSNYDEMSVAELFAEISLYYKNINSTSAPKKDLEEKFGYNNILKLYKKGYLVSLGKNVLLGTVK